MGVEHLAQREHVPGPHDRGGAKKPKMRRHSPLSHAGKPRSCNAKTSALQRADVPGTEKSV